MNALNTTYIATAQNNDPYNGQVFNEFTPVPQQYSSDGRRFVCRCSTSFRGGDGVTGVTR